MSLNLAMISTNLRFSYLLSSNRKETWIGDHEATEIRNDITLEIGMSFHSTAHTQ